MTSIAVLKTGPNVLRAEVRRIETCVRERIESLEPVLACDAAGAQKVIETLLEGPMQFKPVETADGRRYEVTGG